MFRTCITAMSVLLAVPAAAQLPDPLAPVADQAPVSGDPVREKVRDCAGQKFVFAWGGGSRPTKVTLCGEEGASQEAVVKMIEDAAAKVAVTASIPEDRRKAIVQQMEAKVAELKGTPVEVVSLPPGRAPAKPAPMVSTVAPLPVANAAPPARPSMLSPPLPKPRLSLECITPGEFAAGGPCVTLSRDTILIAKAGEALPQAIALRFVRSGEVKADVGLGPMRKGQTVRAQLPREVCAGVSSGEAQVRIIRGGHSVDTLGPFLLRC